MNPAMQPLQPASSTLVGYARVSTASQAESLAEQRDRLHQLGAVRVFEDVASGARADRPGLAAARDFLRAGDTLTVTRLDRLGRSMLDTLTTLHELDTAGVRVRALDLDLDGGRGRWRAGGRGAERGDQAGRLQCRPAGKERNQLDPGRLT